MTKHVFVSKSEGESNFSLKEVDIPASAGGLGFKIAHASWNGSSSFDWTNDEIASLGVANVTRESKGVYRVTFTENFSSSRYTVTTSVGSENYGGVGASPRTVSILLGSQTVSTVDVVCERTDDAVNEDNEYMSIFVIGS